MSEFQIVALEPELAREVRETRRSPRYGHPAVQEVAGGTGPCRSCLRLFLVGEEQRLLFTHQPWSGRDAVGAPGPVFIHAEECRRFEGSGLPDDLQRLALILEARTHTGRIVAAEQVSGPGAATRLAEMLDDAEVDFVFIRNALVGCHIARAERA